MRLTTIGAELQSTTSGVEWDTTAGTVAIETTIVRSGAASIKVAPAAGTGSITHQLYTASTNLLDVYTRFYLYIGTLPAATVQIFAYRGVTAGGNVALLRLTSAGKLQLFGGSSAGTQQGSDSPTLNTGQWYMIEIHSGSTGTALATPALDAQIDGVQFASGTWTASGAHPNMDQIRLGVLNGTSSPILYFDDIAVNDTTNDGSGQTGFPGQGKYVHLFVNGNGDVHDTAETYTDTDDKPTPDDGGSWANFTTIGWRYDVALEDTSVPGIGTNDTITLVHAGIRMAGNTTGVYAGTLGIRSASGGTLQSATSGSSTGSGTPWVTHVGTAPFLPKLTSWLDPTTGIAWKPTGTNSLDNAQIRFTSTDVTPPIHITMLWLGVEYIPNLTPPARIPRMGFVNHQNPGLV